MTRKYTVTSQERAYNWFALMHRVIDGDIHPSLVTPLMMGTNKLQIDFKAAKNWNPQIAPAHAQN